MHFNFIHDCANFCRAVKITFQINSHYDKGI